MKLTRDPPSGSSLALTPEWSRERRPAHGHPAPERERHQNVPERDTWQFGQNRVRPWVRLRDRTRRRAVSRALGEVTLAELLGTDEDERTADEGPWVRA